MDTTVAEKKWLTDGAEQIQRLDYPLTEQSIVFDVGGCTGKFTADLLARGQNPTVYIFEPVKVFADACQERFKDNKKVHVLPYGLSNRSRNDLLAIDGEASSLHRSAKEYEEVPLLDIAIIAQYIRKIDLISINIEGEEYALLDRILKSGLAQKFNYIQVQFHDFVPDAEKLRDGIRQRLSITHEEHYCYPFVWESWKLKNA